MFHFSYVNNIQTPDGGTHEIGFKSGLTKVLSDLAIKNSTKSKEAGLLVGDDFREGLTCVLTVKMRNVQFEGQTKTKLGNSEVSGIVQSAMNEYLSALYPIGFRKLYCAGPGD